MRQPTRSFRTLCLVATLATLPLVGCTTYQGPSPSDFDKVRNDPNLSMSEKNAKMEQMAESADFYAPNYGLIFGLVGAGVLLLIGRSVVMRRLEEASTGKSRPAKKPDQSAKQKPKAAPPAPNPAAKAEPGKVDDGPVKLPASQLEVDALPFEERGTSFFTARPAPADMLEYADIETGIWIHSVVCTREEAQQVAIGKIPLIRAFTVGDKTAPWYDWDGFNPYDNYWDAMSGDWRVGGARAIACWISLDQCDPALKGYYMGSRDEEEEERTPAGTAGAR